MKSAKDIKKLAERLARFSITPEGTVDLEAATKVVSLIAENKLDTIGVKLAPIQNVQLLKDYYVLLKNSAIADTLLITTAIPLTENEKSVRGEYFSHMFHKKNIYFAVDERIIGGVKIQAGWDNIDDTIQHILHTLQTHDGKN